MPAHTPPPPADLGRVLIIAGSDSGGGAGIQGDIKAITMLGGFAATAITAITVQNTLGVHGVHPLPLDLIEEQARAVLDDIGTDAVKTGMLGSIAVIERVAAILDTTPAPTVVDPVMIAKGGHPLLDADAVLKPEEIAKNYVWLHSQQRSAWTFEMDLRPFKETW